MKATVQNEVRPETDHSTEFVSPPVNIFESNDGYVLEAEMPGVSKDGLEVTLEGNEMTIVGHRRSETLGNQMVFRESHLADFKRVFELDPAIDTTKISARMNQGVLTLTLPKSENVKPRRITVD